MTLSRFLITLGASACIAGASSAYTLSVRTGSLPDDVTTLNVNALLPDADGYERGWTEDGWTVDRFGTRGYILVSPTYTASATRSENILRLPPLDITEGDCLSWDIRSAMPDFPESYLVRIYPADASADSADVLHSESETPAAWRSHIVSLAKYAGRKMVIEFVANSTSRYLLCLDAVSVKVPSAPSMQALRTSDIFFDRYDVESHTIGTDLTITNTGIAITEGRLECRSAGDVADALDISSWQVAEQRSVHFSLPEVSDIRKSYEVWLCIPGAEDTLVYEGEYFCSTFRPSLLVDKGTGQWCINCPRANLDVQALHEAYGDRLIMLETHNADRMANDEYFSRLKFREIPYFMLDRITATRSSGYTKFAKYIFRPCTMQVEISDITNEDNNQLLVSGTLTVAETLDNATDRYRMAYVLTSTVYRPDEGQYWQRNSLTQPSGEQYYFLPSQIPAPLNVFHDVTLTYESAFDGLAESLPTSVDAFSPATFSFVIPRPENISTLEGVRVVVYLLDTESGETPAAAFEYAPAESSAVRGIESEGTASLHTLPGVYDLTGRYLGTSTECLTRGLYLVNGQKIFKH